ncbi:UDP-N-acetylglucosamine 2-epimerase [Jidongwangia harbinensis]|uniref:UDP-N-acetylglucosamine 2-epimerase n=1 Tax=Jidongwangia harbinensis TaxID=2878561 RepID=UPI001CD9474D|nr:UDP-N-acetylglucosamine 2-epimerase [Jidongwangia harbinensis]MCA2215761.1 UDP-N-acetylglucosamine 2-epimerase [Jidongwangia harbinensis]
MSIPEVHLVCGTRPEAVQLAPVAGAMTAAGLLRPVLVAGGPEPDAVARTLARYRLQPEISLREPAGNGHAELVGAMIHDLDRLWAGRTPSAVLVQGASITSLAAALAAHWRRIPVVHVEAGLRAESPDRPAYRDDDRRLVTQVAALHLAPTALAAMNLLDERRATGDVLVSGSTLVDAALQAAGPGRAANRRLVLAVTEHTPARVLVAGARRLIERYPDVHVRLATSEPVHLDVDRVTVTAELSHADLSRSLSEASLLITDSAGLQEAPSFGVPALLLGPVAERIEALEAGCARLIDPDIGMLVRESAHLLDSQVRRAAMVAGDNPYGDGHAARRAAQATAALLGLAVPPEPMPSRRIAPTVSGAHA